LSGLRAQDAAQSGRSLPANKMPKMRGIDDTLIGAIMPIYEYKCMSCGRISEVYVPSLRKDPAPVCRHCQSKALEKRISTPSVVRLGNASQKGLTCCGSTERCDTPPCATGSGCRR